MISRSHAVILAGILALVGFNGPVPAEDSEEARLIEINRSIMEDMILRKDPAKFLAYAHEDFRVVAPGGRIENREQVVAGASSFDADGVSVTEEQVSMIGDTAVIIGRLEIDGVMRPVGKLAPMKFMAVFVRAGEDWKLFSRALTLCLPIAIEHGFC